MGDGLYQCMGIVYVLKGGCEIIPLRPTHPKINGLVKSTQVHEDLLIKPESTKT
jgi:hypothetical protein